MLNILKGFGSNPEKDEDLNLIREKLKELFDADELVKKSSQLYVTRQIKTLIERDYFYDFLFQFSYNNPRIALKSELRCNVEINEKIISISINDWEENEIFRSEIFRGFSDIESFEFWKIRIKNHKGDDIFILTLPFKIKNLG